MPWNSIQQLKEMKYYLCNNLDRPQGNDAEQKKKKKKPTPKGYTPHDSFYMMFGK